MVFFFCSSYGQKKPYMKPSYYTTVNITHICPNYNSYSGTKLVPNDTRIEIISQGRGDYYYASFGGKRDIFYTKLLDARRTIQDALIIKEVQLHQVSGMKDLPTTYPRNLKPINNES